MELSGSHTYAARVDQVIAMLADPDVTVAKYESMGHRDVRVLEVESSDDSLRVRASRVVDVQLPGFAKAVLKPTNTMLQTDEWSRNPDGSWSGTFDVDVKGAPVHISGRMKLTPQGDECVHDVAVKVDVHVPLVGGRIASWAANGDVRRSIEEDAAFNSEWLAGHPPA